MSVEIIEARDYDIKVGDIFRDLKTYFQGFPYSRYVVFMDENTRKHCYPVFLNQMKDMDIELDPVVIQSGESKKTLKTCEDLWGELTALKADRNSLVINLSGGVLGDMGGFVAATYKRGVRFINLPTSLLSMVDASVGGKLGIDFEGLKNHIGLFQNPQRVYIYPHFLKTLPYRELLSGFAEMLKHGLVADYEYFLQIKNAGRPEEIREDQWEALISSSVMLKNRIVRADPLEQGKRKILNFGHTAGHAIESWSFLSDQPLRHGEAIAVGMIIELYLSVIKTGLEENKAEEIINYLMDMFPYYKVLHDTNPSGLVSYMQQDKKNRNGLLVFSLLEKPGKPRYDIEVEENEVHEAFNKYLNFKK
ncbi:MAG: 3-dehydroquinate synthase [Bacteroidales bacterium]|nr:3-dehydroquinate synthase [Bacteroidales bacterium]MCF8333895.1 3-dehydroquinate synthase [Bacteroidales bacterium]